MYFVSNYATRKNVLVSPDETENCRPYLNTLLVSAINGEFKSQTEEMARDALNEFNKQLSEYKDIPDPKHSYRVDMFKEHFEKRILDTLQPGIKIIARTNVLKFILEEKILESIAKTPIRLSNVDNENELELNEICMFIEPKSATLVIRKRTEKNENRCGCVDIRVWREEEKGKFVLFYMEITKHDPTVWKDEAKFGAAVHEHLVERNWKDKDLFFYSVHCHQFKKKTFDLFTSKEIDAYWHEERYKPDSEKELIELKTTIYSERDKIQNVLMPKVIYPCVLTGMKKVIVGPIEKAGTDEKLKMKTLLLWDDVSTLDVEQKSKNMLNRVEIEFGWLVDNFDALMKSAARTPIAETKTSAFKKNPIWVVDSLHSWDVSKINLKTSDDSWKLPKWSTVTIVILATNKKHLESILSLYKPNGKTTEMNVTVLIGNPSNLRDIPKSIITNTVATSCLERSGGGKIDVIICDTMSCDAVKAKLPNNMNDMKQFVCAKVHLNNRRTVYIVQDGVTLHQRFEIIPADIRPISWLDKPNGISAGTKQFIVVGSKKHISDTIEKLTNIKYKKPVRPIEQVTSTDTSVHFVILTI